jgi:hypothetical protein
LGQMIDHITSYRILLYRLLDATSHCHLESPPPMVLECPCALRVPLSHVAVLPTQNRFPLVQSPIEVRFHPIPGLGGVVRFHPIQDLGGVRSKTGPLQGEIGVVGFHREFGSGAPPSSRCARDIVTSSAVFLHIQTECNGMVWAMLEFDLSLIQIAFQCGSD